MRFTRARDLVAAALLAAVAGHLLVRAVYADLPSLPALAGLPLLVLAVIELVLGFSLRAKVRMIVEGRPIEAITVARAVALAKASSLLGSIMVGVWLGVLGYLLPKRSVITAAEEDVPATVVGTVCAAALVAAALWLEHCCRAPSAPEDVSRIGR